MYIIARSPRARLISAAVSLVIFAIIYFTVIKPSNDTANNAVRVGEQQAQQAVNAANKATGGAVPKSAQNLVACVAAAGTDTGKLTACQAKFH
jgi:type II secretory pathway component PulM